MADEDDEEPPSFSRLPDELLFDIFSRFPAKSLCQFRCVCSKWSSLLTSDRDFVSLYHRRHRINPLILFAGRRSATGDGGDGGELVATCHCIDDGAIRFNFNFPADLSGRLIWMLSCNGIVCLIHESKVFLHDPVTGRESILTDSTNFKSSSCAALGYSAISGEFKLLHFYTVEKFDNYHYSKIKELGCEILTVPHRTLGFDSSPSSEQWRPLGRSKIDVLGRKSCACVDASIYWLVKEKTYDAERVRILRFDLNDEEFGVVCFPRRFSNRSVECLGLMEMKQKLCLTDKLPWEATMAIWQLDDGRTDQWTKKYEIDLSGLDLRDFKVLGHVSPSIGDGEGELVIKLGVNQPVVYDLENAAFREIEIETENDEQDESNEAELLLDRKNLL